MNYWIKWTEGKKRMSRHCNEPFVTRKDLRIFNRQFLKTRERRREYDTARRTKAVKTFEEQERHDNPGHPTLMYLGRGT